MTLAGRGRGTLFAQVFALVLLVVVGAETINLLIVWNYPPPPPNLYTEADVMRALHGLPPAPNRPERNNPPLAISHEPPTIEAARDSRTGFLGFRSLMAKDLGL